MRKSRNIVWKECWKDGRGKGRMDGWREYEKGDRKRKKRRISRRKEREKGNDRKVKGEGREKEKKKGETARRKT